MTQVTQYSYNVIAHVKCIRVTDWDVTFTIITLCFKKIDFRYYLINILNHLEKNYSLIY